MALDYLAPLDIETDQADDCHNGWKQLKLMLEGDGRQALQALMDNGAMTEKSMKTLHAALDATGTTIKSEEHFWAHQDELLSDVRQLPCKGIHALSWCTCNLITQCWFPHAQSQEMLKLMVLQHAV